jgi:phosphatidylglycerophosphate synthase
MSNLNIKNSIASALHKVGISADFLTFSGLILAGVSGYCISTGNLFWAGALLLFSGLLDMLDGAVARVSGRQSAFGGILDSSLDRYGDGFIFGGMILYFISLQRIDLVIWTLSAWVAAFSISYVRARVECEVDSCRVGFWERGERIGFIVIALFVSSLPTAAIILGLALHWTVFQRLALSYVLTNRAGASASKLPFFLRPSRRAHWIYYLKVTALVLALVFLRG